MVPARKPTRSKSAQLAGMSASLMALPRERPALEARPPACQVVQAGSGILYAIRRGTTPIR